VPWASHTAGDVCIACSADTRRRPEAVGLVLTTCILASSLAFIDGSVVNVGLVAIGRSFDAHAEDLQWVINAYLLPLCTLLLLGGAAGDRFGRRRVLISGITLFGASSLLCAVASSLAWLLAARAMQGIGAALLLPNSLAILGAASSGDARGRAVGTWSAAGSIAGAIGPVLGGWLIDFVGWRAIFLLNLPLAVAAIGLAIASIRDPTNNQNAPIDFAGALLAAASLVLLTWALTVGISSDGWSTSASLALIIGAALFVLFLWVEMRRRDDAIMPLALFSSRNFIGLNILTLLLYGALGALFVLVPYLLIKGGNFSSTTAGAALLPLPIILGANSRGAGTVAGRIGSTLPLTLGPIVVAAGFLLLLRYGPGSDYWHAMLPALVVISIGMAAAVAPLTTAVLASVDARHTGSASGLNSALARLGGLMATALLGGVFAASGEALFSGFYIAAIVCSATALLSSAAAFALTRSAG
jgi:EmrB/QacA subfamily drug resistance transporter